MRYVALFVMAHSLLFRPSLAHRDLTPPPSLSTHTRNNKSTEESAIGRANLAESIITSRGSTLVSDEGEMADGA